MSKIIRTVDLNDPFAPPEDIISKFWDVRKKYAKLIVNTLWINSWGLAKVVYDSPAMSMLEYIRNELRESGLKIEEDKCIPFIEMKSLIWSTSEQLSYSSQIEKTSAEVINYQIKIMAFSRPLSSEVLEYRKHRLIAFEENTKIRRQRELEGKYKRTTWYYPTEFDAEASWVPSDHIWEQLVYMCCLDQEDFLQAYDEQVKKVKKIESYMNEQKFERLRYIWDGIDLKVPIHQDMRRVGADNRNTPSLEVYTVVDWRWVEGRISFSEPLFRQGKKITNIQLEIEKGEVLWRDADENKDALDQLFSIPGSRRMCEAAIVDERLYNKNVIEKDFQFKTVSSTLINENLPWIHFAFWDSWVLLSKCFTLNDQHFSKEILEQEYGSNRSSIHVDMVHTSPLRILGYKDGEDRLIVEDRKLVEVDI